MRGPWCLETGNSSRTGDFHRLPSGGHTQGLGAVLMKMGASTHSPVQSSSSFIVRPVEAIHGGLGVVLMKIFAGEYSPFRL